MMKKTVTLLTLSALALAVVGLLVWPRRNHRELHRWPG